MKFLTLRKIKLLIQLWVTYHLSYFFKKDIRKGRYVALSIEPTNICNLSCLECPTGTDSLNRKKGCFSLEAFNRLLLEKAKDLIYMNFYFQGEPFLNKNLVKMIQMASEKKIYTSLSTNAQLIDRTMAQEIVTSGLNRIILSIDGTTQEVYEKYRRGGKLDLVIKASRYLLEARALSAKKYPKIVFQFLVFKHNEHQIDDIKKMARKMKVDKLEIKTAQIYNFQTSTEGIPTIDKYARYRKGLDGRYTIKSKLPNKCWRMWHSAVITQDLDVVPCCYDKDASHCLGNLTEHSITKIERDEKYKTFRQKILNERSSVAICNNCSEGLSI